MLCTAVSSVLEYNIISFVAGSAITAVLFIRHMWKHRRKLHQDNKAVD